MSNEHIEALTIAGNDSDGSAGMPADLHSFYARGVYGMGLLTAAVAGNSQGIFAQQLMPLDFIQKQFDVLNDDFKIKAVKTGMLANKDIIDVVAKNLKHYQMQNIVLDPVMVATSGAKLIEDDAIAALTSKLFPLATVITPNMPETQALCELAVEQGADAIDYENGENISSENDMVTAGHLLAGHFGCAVLVKGGHGTQDASDVLVEPSGKVTWFRARRIDNPNTHGTGCTLSSAIASHLALGETLPEAVNSAKLYLTGALEAQLDLDTDPDRWTTLGNGADRRSTIQAISSR